MAPKRFPSLVLFGAPGVGKGTQGRVLGDLPGFLHVSSGEIFRELDPDSAEAQHVCSYTDRGELVPDELTVDVWRQAIGEKVKEGLYAPQTDILVLDGIPRSVQQSELLEDYIDVLRIIHLAASNIETMVNRMKARAIKENRVDDDDETVIRRRFEVYREETEPLLNYYPSNLICTVDALGSPAQVLRDVLDYVIAAQNEYFD